MDGGGWEARDEMQRERDEARAALAQTRRVAENEAQVYLTVSAERDEARAELAVLRKLYVKRVHDAESRCDEARAIARRLRQMAHPVDQDDGEVVTAFDALPWAKGD